MPSFIAHSTLAPTFQPSPLTLCSLPSSVFTVAMPLSSIAVTVPFISPAKASVVPKTKTAQVRARVFPSFRIITISSTLSLKRCPCPYECGTLIGSLPLRMILQKGLKEITTQGVVYRVTVSWAEQRGLYQGGHVLHRSP